MAHRPTTPGPDALHMIRRPGLPLALTLAFLLPVLGGVVGCGPAPGEDPERMGAEDSDRASVISGRTLEAPPELEVGEWWTVEVEPELVGTTFRTTLVVTERSDGRVVLGIPPEEFEHHFLVLHVPPLGDLELDTFAWHVMWDDFEALRFPLEPGRSWEADFHGNDVVAEVTSVEGNRARVHMTGQGEQIDLVYDADVGMITEFREGALLLGFRVVDHGFDYEGEVMSLSGIRLGLMESGPDEPAGEEAGSPARSTSTVEVASGASHGSLNFVLWNTGTDEDSGRYRIVATAPDGSVFDETFEPPPGSPTVIPASFGHDAVDGTWQIDFERDGPGRLLVELFTYDLEEVRLGGR